MNDAERDELSDTLHRVPLDLFAVADGAHFDDFPLAARQSGFITRALYYDAGDTDGVAAGPHLVRLKDDTLERFVDLVGDLPAAVYWSWPDTEETLFRHLRKIAKVEIPVEGGVPTATDYELVLFRHADPNVMASVLTVFDIDQYAKLFGAAAGLVMLASDYGGVRRSPRPKDLPEVARPGPIRLSTAQIETLNDIQVHRSRLKVIAYLKGVDESATVDRDDRQMYEIVRRYENSGKSVGLESERAQMKWAYLMSISNGEIETYPEIKSYFRNSRKHPDDTIDDILEDLDRLWPKALK